MTLPPAWASQQLGEFLTAVSSFETEASAGLRAVERVAEALDAEVAAIVSRGKLVAAVGYPAGATPVAELDAVARGVSRELAVPGVGVCPAARAPLEHPPDATLVLARSGPRSLSAEETSVLRGMARVTSMTMRTLALLSDERALREEQAALRRVAVLVARGVPQNEIFAAVAQEASRLACAELVQIHRYDKDGSSVAVAVWGSEDLEVGVRSPKGQDNIRTTVLRTGRTARRDDVVGSPIVVDGRLWGVLIAATIRPGRMPPEAEARIAGFTELVATAISNAQTRAELAASRARVVAASDETRRRIERDLHDGTQQRLVALALLLHSAADAIPAELPGLRVQLSHAEEELQGLLDEVREIARGLHPAILSKGGLVPALGALARRSSLPVQLDVRAPEPLPEPVEVAAYYAISEALTNAAKHANASAAHVALEARNGRLHVQVRDDGVGGADPARGSGIVSLCDRVEALGGTIVVSSPPGEGTSMVVELPIRPRPGIDVTS
ncbi:MAG: hypothetical protein JWO02_3803 [Solirubrobacterales bacterium]|nr:hypothetical protein [Solirubrobacterales bacterium]